MRPLGSRAGEEDAAAAAAAAAAEVAAAEIERLLGYRFSNRSLLEEALTHPSCADHHSYQRLEFVGDAALGLAFTNFLYLTNPSLGPGTLSVLRAANISTEKLARAAVRHSLYRFLRRNSANLDQTVSDFTDLVMMEREEDRGWIPYGGSTVRAPKVLADIVESIAGAVYTDSNFNLELLWKVFMELLEPIITAENLDEQPVTTLYVFCQKQGKSLDIKNWKQGSLNIADVFINGILVGSGSSEQKSIAKLNAARNTLQKLSSSHITDMDVDMCLTNGNEITDEKGSSKKRLHELCCKKHWLKPIYKIEIEQGPEHSKRFVCSVHVETTNCTYVVLGDPKSRVKDAKSSAASKLLLDILTNGVVK